MFIHIKFEMQNTQNLIKSLVFFKELKKILNRLAKIIPVEKKFIMKFSDGIYLNYPSPVVRGTSRHLTYNIGKSHSPFF